MLPSVDVMVKFNPPMTRSRIAYVSGPMRGYIELNFPLFNKVAKELEDLGYRVLNPAAKGEHKDWLPEDYLRCDLKMVCDSDFLVVLPGWEKSWGAKLEISTAESLKIPCYSSVDFNPIWESATLQAHRLVHGDRQEDYSHPIYDFTRTATFWTEILQFDVTPEQVGLCMIALKLSREVHKHKKDNLVDICGYAETVDMVHHLNSEGRDS